MSAAWPSWLMERLLDPDAGLDKWDCRALLRMRRKESLEAYADAGWVITQPRHVGTPADFFYLLPTAAATRVVARMRERGCDTKAIEYLQARIVEHALEHPQPAPVWDAEQDARR